MEQGSLRPQEDQDPVLAQDAHERPSADDDVQVLQLHAESVVVSRRVRERALVRVATTTRLVDRQIEEDLAEERVEVERISIGKFVDVMPSIREEGDVTVMPVVEEVVIVERKLRLKEEVHIRRIRAVRQHRETIQLREQDAVITRTDLTGSGSADEAPGSGSPRNQNLKDNQDGR